ncbi:2-oxoglutarate ferredoxin oxidoreductase subunit gamma [Clostridia bacterium]|nr:2-oxoglutarate ferredoxin oxidoreductase subunit gamma [Clostridia bacterium]GHU75063.1 2-oxoglutarate ferredoxin oxidoreductase subunit gamma [Clostridia bacterium]
MAESNILLAGFGGQGILFAGKFIVYTGLIADKHVSWLPSYGPEMRGGTANCSVIVSDAEIGSPIVTNPDILIVMNRPSLDRYEKDCKSNGFAFVNSTLIDKKVERRDVRPRYIPATELADEHGIPKLANMVMVGYVIKQTGICTQKDIFAAMKKTVPERKTELFDGNMRAVQIGYSYE